MAMEVKVYCRKKKREKTQQIDYIPKCFQLPRSHSVSKPRTDFSLPICCSKELERRSSKEIQSNVTVRCSDMSNDTIRGTVNPSSNISTEPESRRQDAHVQPCSNRNRNDEESSEVCTTPGNVVWAKKDGQCWWPAELSGERSSLARSGVLRIEGHVLVQYFGKRGSAWVDPATDLSPFEECFKERSCNQAKEFQNALKQALYHKEHPRSCKESYSSPDTHDRLNHPHQLPEKDNSSSSSRAGRARSKRERKRKVHFDEVSCPLYTSRKVRRFKIMRSLGLAAPVGSPFISS